MHDFNTVASQLGLTGFESSTRQDPDGNCRICGQWSDELHRGKCPRHQGRARR